MAKGFTVKAKAPTAEKKKVDWDIEAIKERMRGKTVVFCLPGRGCSYIFLKNFVQMCFDLVQAGMSIQISQDYSSMVNFARCKCLGANVLRGPDQVPWDGKLQYDYQLWIDSDIVFNTNQFWQLCDMAIAEDGTEKEIVAEIQRLKGQKTMIVIAHRLTTVQHCDRIYRLEQGKIVEEGTPEQILKLQRAANA